MAENWWPIRLNSVMMDVLLPMNVADIFKPRMEEGQMCLDSKPESMKIESQDRKLGTGKNSDLKVIK